MTKDSPFISFIGNAFELVFFQGGICTYSTFTLLVFLWKLQIAILRDSKANEGTEVTKFWWSLLKKLKLPVLPTPLNQKSAWGRKKIGKIGNLGLQKSAENRPHFLPKFPPFLTPLTLSIAFLCDNFFKVQNCQILFPKLSQYFGNYERFRFLRISIFV